METKEIDYQERIARYSLEELIDISYSIDKEAHPERYRLVQDRILQIKSTISKSAPDIFGSSQEVLNFDSILRSNNPSQNIFSKIGALGISLIVFAALGLLSWKPIDLVI